ncbi:MAG TPA: thiamine-phosphate kinase [Vicinamibacterales bacterium]|nr:thiamine-phosphate kinase [Vicinamibacterales bacterium]
MIGEHDLIERLRTRAGAPPAWVTIGIGDDAAVVEPGRGELVTITTDSLVDGVHFKRAWTPLASVGHKALAVSLSDLAAMGATPRASLLSLALPPDFSLQEFDDLIDAFIALGHRAGAPLVGGNLTRTPGPLVVDSTAIGSVRPRRVMRRGGGRAGDELYVTGALGAAAAGLAMLTASVDRSSLSSDERACIEWYERPDARLRCGLVVGRARAAAACMDLSDGLADAARQIAAASHTGVVIAADSVPIHAGAASWAARTGGDAIALAMAGGEDYELLFAVRPRERRAFKSATRHCGDLPITLVGRLTDESGAWIERDGKLSPLPPGFSHF